MSDFYIYALIDPRKDEIFYIGKGKGNRYLEHIKELKELDKKHSQRKKGINPNKVERIKAIIESGEELKYKFIAENLKENSAYILEEILVERFGRKILKNGKLLNLEPGGKWEYPKVILKENEKTSMKEVEDNYPELIEILKNYPKISTESKLRPWWINKIPKRFALYQYDLNGKFIATHNTSHMNFATGMSWRIIDKCIGNNNGYAYGFQWSKELKPELPNIATEDIETLENFTRWRRTEITDLEMAENYRLRNQEVEQ